MGRGRQSALSGRRRGARQRTDEHQRDSHRQGPQNSSNRNREHGAPQSTSFGASPSGRPSNRPLRPLQPRPPATRQDAGAQVSQDGPPYRQASFDGSVSSPGIVSPMQAQGDQWTPPSNAEGSVTGLAVVPPMQQQAPAWSQQNMGVESSTGEFEIPSTNPNLRSGNHTVIPQCDMSRLETPAEGLHTSSLGTNKPFCVMTGPLQVHMALSIAVQTDIEHSFITPWALSALGCTAEPLPPIYDLVGPFYTLAGPCSPTHYVQHVRLEPFFPGQDARYLNLLVLPENWPWASMIVGRRFLKMLSSQAEATQPFQRVMDLQNSEFLQTQ